MTVAEGEPERRDGWATVILDACGTLALLAYPLVVYFGYRRGDFRVTALVLIFLVAPIGIVRLRRWGGSHARTLAIVPLVTATLLGLSALLNAAGLMLAVPTAINAVLLLLFGATLWGGPPMVERLARLQDPELSAAEMRWCRLWTQLWCGFFALNALLSAALAFLGDLQVWAVYNGGIAYGLMGLMFTVEWVLRKFRFGGAGSSALGRLLVRLGAPEERR